MKYQGMRKVHEGRFITRYDVDYVTEAGNPKTYEIISRNRDMKTLEELQNTTPDSVILIMTDADGERILVNREYRMAMAQWIYNFPAGLIDPGETPEESARRELWEETGLTITRIDDVLDGSYSVISGKDGRFLTVNGFDGSDGAKTTPQAVKTIARDVSALPRRIVRRLPIKKEKKEKIFRTTDQIEALARELVEPSAPDNRACRIEL